MTLVFDIVWSSHINGFQNEEELMSVKPPRLVVLQGFGKLWEHETMHLGGLGKDLVVVCPAVAVGWFKISVPAERACERGAFNIFHYNLTH